MIINQLINIFHVPLSHFYTLIEFSLCHFSSSIAFQYKSKSLTVFLHIDSCNKLLDSTFYDRRALAVTMASLGHWRLIVSPLTREEHSHMGSCFVQNVFCLFLDTRFFGLCKCLVDPVVNWFLESCKIFFSFIIISLQFDWFLWISNWLLHFS